MRAVTLDANYHQDLTLHIHIIGICGTFMGGVALLARSMGHQVSGSDANVYPPMDGQLRAAGIELTEGYSAANLNTNPDVVVIGNALSRGNEEVEAVLDRGLRYTSGAQWLKEHFLFGRWVVAVAGTHGKTTTASMVAWILEYAGLEPGFLIGGVPENFGCSAREGGGSFFVVEADEYDTAFFDKRSKFVHYCPRTAVLNNLEYDHSDVFENLQAIKKQFHHFVRTVPQSGLLVVNQEDTHLQDVITMGCWSRVETFSSDNGQGHWRIASNGTLHTPDQAQFNIEPLPSLTGDHNLSNACAAVAAARHAGVPVAVCIEALARFAGVKRRLDLLGQINDITLYDDFAHHPTAIAATLKALRQGMASEARLIALVDFCSNSMTAGTHLDAMGDALKMADFALLHCVIDSLNLQSLCDEAGDDAVTAHRDTQSMLDRLRTLAAPGDVLVCMSNGSFQAIQSQILTMLNEQLPQS